MVLVKDSSINTTPNLWKQPFVRAVVMWVVPFKTPHKYLTRKGNVGEPAGIQTKESAGFLHLMIAATSANIWGGAGGGIGAGSCSWCILLTWVEVWKQSFGAALK